MVLRTALEQLRHEPAVSQAGILELRINLVTLGRPMDEQLLRIAMRKVGAIQGDEIAMLVAQNNGYVQFTCHRGPGDDCDYVDPPVVTVHEDGTWERV